MLGTGHSTPVRAPAAPGSSNDTVNQGPMSNKVWCPTGVTGSSGRSEFT